MSNNGPISTTPEANTTGHHWMLDWMDEFEVTSGKEVANRIELPGALQRLYDLANTNEKNTVRSSVELTENAVVGGGGFDMGVRGNLCAHPLCRIESMNTEVVQALHYFDSMVVEGPSSDLYRSFFEDTSQSPSDIDLLLQRLSWDIETLAYVRTSGLADYFQFVKKPHAFCQNHFTVHAQELGIGHLSTREEVKEMARRVAREGSISIRPAGDQQWVYVIKHPMMDNVNLVVLRGKSAPPRYMAVEKVLREELTVMVSDFATAKVLEKPLATAVRPAIFAANNNNARASVDDVAACLKLPFLAGLKASEFVRLRTEHWDDFLKFRAALTAAIKETLDAKGSASAERIATRLRRDFIEPAMADISRKVRLNNRSTIFKSIAGTTVGSTVAAFGALTSMPMLITAGIAAAATPLVQTYKYFDDKREIELSDMYFLWRSASLANR